MADDSLRDVLNHLEFLGYQAEAQDDGWVFVSHAVRADFFVKAFPFGIRAVAAFRNDDAMCDPEWFAFVNRCNEVSNVARFSLFSKNGQGSGVRSVVVFPLVYDRVMFGVWMEALQQDLSLLRDAPERKEAPAVMH